MTFPVLFFKTSPEIIRLAVVMCGRYPLSLRNVEDLLHERGIDICLETVRLWWNCFGPRFAAEIRRRRVRKLRAVLAMALGTPVPDLSGKRGTEPVPTEPHRLVADVDAAFVEKIFNVAKREWIADAEQHRDADPLWRVVEVTERISHRERLRTCFASLKPICLDTAL